MQQVSDQIDKFHEDVCDWHLYEDILEEEKKATDSLKTNFYAADDYLHYHKSILKRELKAVIRKHAIPSVEKHRAHEEAQY